MQARTTPAVPPAPGQTPVWPAPNTAPPSTQETPVERPRWDGLAYIAYAEQEDIDATLKQEKFAVRIIADEQVASQ